MMLKSTIKYLLCLLLLHGVVKAQLAISSVVPTESSCQANGTLTITASGGVGPYQYELTAGPPSVTFPLVQSPSNLFNALPAGSYTVRVVDLGNSSAFVTQTGVIIPGTYVIPDLNPVVTLETCFNASDASITANGSSGILPYTYELIAPSTVIVAAQSSDVFSGLPAGTYTLRMTDGCSNIQTRTVVIDPTGGAAPVGISLINSGLKKTSCDVFSSQLQILPRSVSENKPPYTITWTTSNHIGDQTFQASGPANAYLYPPEIVTITGYGETGTATLTNACGVVVGTYAITPNKTLYVSPDISSCQRTYSAFMYVEGRAPVSDFFLAPITYNLVSLATTPESIVATQVNNPTFIGFPEGPYRIDIVDNCGSTSSITFDWIGLGAPEAFVSAVTSASCADHTSTIYIDISNSTFTNVRIISGPAFASSTKPGYEFNLPYNYPITIADQVIKNLAPGTYQIEVNGTCGLQKIINFTILDDQTTNPVHTFTYTLGCLNNNTINFTAKDDSPDPSPFKAYSIVNSSNDVLASGSGTISATATINNLPAGTYTLFIDYDINNLGTSALASCPTVTQTLVIPGYVQPEISLIIQVVCNGTSYAIIQPNLAAGVAPYTYAIRPQGSGPYSAAQASPSFPISVSGIYDFQMTDACGNSVTTSVALGTVTLPQPVKTGTGCIGSDISFTMPSNSYYTYTWTKPNSTTYTGNVLSLSPVTLADIGTYTVVVTSNLPGGCTSNSTITFTLSSSCALPVSLISFAAEKAENNVILIWKTSLEEDMKGYSIERSINAKSFAAVGFVGSNNDIRQKYWSFIDKTVETRQTYYYRLKMINLDGTFALSTIRTITLGEPDQTMQLFANPVGSPSTKLKIPRSLENELLQVTVITVDGRQVRQESVQASGPILNLEQLSALRSGSYLLKIQDRTGNANTVRFLVP